MIRGLRRAAVSVSLLAAYGLLSPLAAGASTPPPSGQMMVGGASFDFATMTFVGGGGTVEPAYNDANGSLVYIYTPNGAHVHPNDHNVAPIYLPVYPVGSTVDPSTLNCAHLPGDNCPDHGPLVAGAVAGTGIYTSGVLGHDHLLGIASSGGDFNVIWEPTLVLFTSMAAADTHPTTLAAIQTLTGDGGAFLVSLPQLDFHCSVVSAARYNNGTPAPVIPST